MPKFSICIPTYEMHGRGVEFLCFNLDRIVQQTFRDYEVIVSDHSMNDAISNACAMYMELSPIRMQYVRNRNSRGSSSANINNAMRFATGDWIKIIFQDDFFYATDSLQKTNDAIKGDHGWLATSSEHTHDGFKMTGARTACWRPNIHLGNNSIGSPTVIALRNTSDKPLFDEGLIWLMDCEYYRKLHDKWGDPLIVPDVTVVNRLWDRRLSNTIPEERKMDEYIKMRNRYGNI